MNLIRIYENQIYANERFFILFILFLRCPIIGVSNSGQSDSLKIILHMKSNSLQN